MRRLPKRGVRRICKSSHPSLHPNPGKSGGCERTNRAGCYLLWDFGSLGFPLFSSSRQKYSKISILRAKAIWNLVSSQEADLSRASQLQFHLCHDERRMEKQLYIGLL